MGDYVHNGFKVGPNYCPPAGPVAGHWIDAYDSRLCGDTGDLCCWWTVFRDPTLNQLIAHAYRQNISLKEAGFRILEARAQRGIAVGGLFPQSQTATASAQRVGLPLDQDPTLATPRFYNLYNAGFNLAWQLDLWGQFRRAVEAADAQLDYSVAGYDEVLITLLADVAQNYVEIRTDQQQIAVLKVNVEVQRYILGKVQKQVEGGGFREINPTKLDLDQLKGLIEQEESEIPPLEADMRQSNDRLCVLLGLPPDDLVKCLGAAAIPADIRQANNRLCVYWGLPPDYFVKCCLGTSAIPTAPPTVAVGIPAQLLTRRPDIRQAERTAAAQSAEIGVAISQAYPMVSISGTLGWQSQQLAKLFTPAGFNGTIGPTFQWNILNYGRLLNNDRYQEARFRELVATYQQTVLQAQSEVENGLAAFLQAQKQNDALYNSVTDTNDAVYRLVLQTPIKVDFNRLATIEQDLVSRELLRAQAQGAIAQGLIQTYLALGGGWEIRCTPQDNCQPLGPIVPPPEPPAEPSAPLTPPSAAAPEVLPAPMPKKEGSPVDSGE
jgi:outer membrane protein TolC